MPKIDCRRFVVGPAGAEGFRAIVLLAAESQARHCDNHEKATELLRRNDGSPTVFTCEGFASIRMVWLPLDGRAALAIYVRQGRVERMDLIADGDDPVAAASAVYRVRTLLASSCPPEVSALRPEAGRVLHASFLLAREAKRFRYESADVLALIGIVPIFCELMAID